MLLLEGCGTHGDHESKQVCVPCVPLCQVAEWPSAKPTINLHPHPLAHQSLVPMVCLCPSYVSLMCPCVSPPPLCHRLRQVSWFATPLVRRCCGATPPSWQQC